MTAKRSRLGRSTSGGTTVLPPPPIRSPPQINPMFPAPNQILMAATMTDNNQLPRKQGIFTVSESVVVDRNIWFKIGGFLDTCCYCKKKIPDNSDVFMYRDLGAYCTVECRQKQIDIDTDRAMMNANPLAKRLYSELHPLLAKAKKRGGVAGS